MTVRVHQIAVPLTHNPYTIFVGHGLLSDPTFMLPRPSGATRALVITQQAVRDAGHVDPVVTKLVADGLNVTTVDVPDGETAKDLTVLGELWRKAAALPLGRGDVIVAVGGGVIGDLAGFVAATYNRGIAVVHIPTTLLAQVDAAIGGKTGINLPEGKNLVGAFHQPHAVVCDIAVLQTLPERIYTEGFGEIVKYALIRDTALIDRLADTHDERASRDVTFLTDVVARCAQVKADIVAQDERESSVRAHLNFGHTYAHALETLGAYGTILHGEAVAVGMVAALNIGVAAGITPPELATKATALIKAVGLPVSTQNYDRDAVWTLMARDKKVVQDAVRFVLLQAAGEPVLFTPPRDMVDSVLDAL